MILVALLAIGACSDDVTHENLDKWMQTEKGPSKLRDALADGSIDPDLSAHAAENLLIIREDGEVVAIVGKMSAERKAAVLGKLAGRLWALARIEGEMTAPNQQQIAAKDLLVDLRAVADDASRQQIDGYLLEWYTGGHYDARAAAGKHTGAQVMRLLGPAAGAGMMSAANAVVGAPAQDGKRLRITDELLLGLAVTADPEAVKYVLDMVDLDRGDPTLPERASAALYGAFVAPPASQFERADGAVLAPHVPRLAKIALDAGRPASMINDAVALIGASGMPHCLPPLVQMINTPHDSERYLWVGANNALRCGGPEAIDDVAAAMPTGGSYEHQSMAGAVVGEIARMKEKAQVLAAARALLDHPSWVARWIGVEVLAKLGSTEDVGKIEALARDGARLHGYFGDQSEVPRKERKAEPTLGKRAAELAKQLKGGA